MADDGDRLQSFASPICDCRGAGFFKRSRSFVPHVSLKTDSRLSCLEIERIGLKIVPGTPVTWQREARQDTKENTEESIKKM